VSDDKKPDFSFSNDVKQEEAAMEKANNHEDKQIENIMGQMEEENRRHRELAE